MPRLWGEKRHGGGRSVDEPDVALLEERQEVASERAVQQRHASVRQHHIDLHAAALQHLHNRRQRVPGYAYLAHLSFVKKKKGGGL